MSDRANVISISGGKDSTTTALKAVDEGAENLTFCFADTGHEHPDTYEYVDYLDGLFKPRVGVGVTTVRADFTAQIYKKRETVKTKWPQDGLPDEQIEQALEVLQPTGVPFLDLCLVKGRFPSSKVRFCTSDLKSKPIQNQITEPLMQKHRAVISWQGIRADESQSRSKMPMHDVELGQWEPEPAGLLVYRPLIDWAAADVFDYQRERGVLPNPLYKQGMSRVGCMPCIFANKGELAEIAKRFPEAFEKLEQWESLVAKASKRGGATFFGPNKTPGHTTGETEENPNKHYGAQAVKDWAKTSHGGRQFDLIAEVESQEAAEDTPACSSVYGLCE